MDTTPSKARYIVTAFVVTLAVITYIDRVGIAVALPLIRDELKLSTIQMGWTLAAFAWAYAVFEIPGGWLGDKIGPRRVLMRIVIWWSFFTAATGWVWNPLVAHRHASALWRGRSGCVPEPDARADDVAPGQGPRARPGVSSGWPRGSVAPSRRSWWRCSSRRSRGAGRSSSSASSASSGRCCSTAGTATHRASIPSVNQAELALLPPAKDTAIAHGGVPWGVIFSNPHVWLLSIQYMCLAYGWWFYINWLPTYLRDARGTSFKMGALLAGLPLLLGGAGCLVSAYLVPRLTKRFGSVSTRAPHHRHHGIRRRLDLHRHLHAHRRPGAGDVRPRHGGVLQRLRDARRLGEHDGHRRPLRRHGLGRHEHDGQHRRRAVGHWSWGTCWRGRPATGR